MSVAVRRENGVTRGAGENATGKVARAAIQLHRTHPLENDLVQIDRPDGEARTGDPRGISRPETGSIGNGTTEVPTVPDTRPKGRAAVSTSAERGGAGVA
jgi:hypothetical protein